MKNKKLLIFTIISVFITFAFISVVISQNKTMKDLTNKKSELTTRHDKLKKDISKAEADNKEIEQGIVSETIGINVSLLNKDEEKAKEFFEPAFSWTNGDEYEEARDAYNKYLGENTFTKTYIPEDIKVELNEGEISRIDFRGIKAHMAEIETIPLTANENRIRYVSIVKYYMYKDKRDLTNLSALEPSTAIVKFTISGEDRTISEVEAWSGFSELE